MSVWLGALFFLTLIILGALAALEALRSYLFPRRCQHGVPLRPGRPLACTECLQIRAAADAEAQRKTDQEKRELLELRIKETENIRQLTYLQQMDPLEFEKVISHAYRSLGFEVEETPASGDGGVDAYIRRDGKTLILQCKRFASARVGAPVLRDLLGTIVAESADGGVLATTSSFTEEAIGWAARAPKSIDLIDGHRLLQIIAQTYPLGSPVPEDFVTKRRHPKVVPSRCPWCGAKTRRRKSRHGAFYGCTAFPRCRWTMPAPGRGYRVVRDRGP
jgi:restriction endonuclease/topoisomerase-like DNA binding C4 zinc finger protein